MRYKINMNSPSHLDYLQETVFEQSGIFLDKETIQNGYSQSLMSKKSSFSYYPKELLPQKGKVAHTQTKVLSNFLHEAGLHITLTQKEKEASRNETIDLPHLTSSAHALRENSLITLAFDGHHHISLLKNNTVFFTRGMCAKQSNGAITRYIENWANIVIIKDNLNDHPTAYLYDGSLGIDDFHLLYGLKQHTIICAGIIKVTAHKLNESITLPKLLFSPKQGLSELKRNEFRLQFMQYSLSLIAPLNIGFTENISEAEIKTGYSHKSFISENRYDEILDAIRKEQHVRH